MEPERQSRTGSQQSKRERNGQARLAGEEKAATGQGLSSVLETLDGQGIDSVVLLGECWTKIEPLLKVGPACRVGKALAARRA